MLVFRGPWAVSDVSPQVLSTLGVQAGSLPGPKISKHTRQAEQHGPGTCLSPPLWHWRYTYWPPNLVFVSLSHGRMFVITMQSWGPQALTGRICL